MTRFVGVLLALTAIFLPPTAAHAWSADGHKVACAIAWDELTSTARGGVKIILGIDTKDQFVEDCIWADTFALDNPEIAPWHFVPVPLRRKTIDIERDCSDPKSCAITQIERNIALVRDGPTNLDKSNPLKFLIHLVADLHQPLHVAHQDDEFGVNVSATFMGKRSNLHAVWDTEILNEHGVQWKELGTQLREDTSRSKRSEWMMSTPLDWARESLEISLSNSTGYSRFTSVVLGRSYFEGNVDIALERLSMAGIRLGHILNVLLD
jgi:hypothetical protein